MTIQLPGKVKFIIDTLTDAGWEAWAVGGCVRDSVLGRVPGDWDITTSASPEQVKQLFPKTVDTGIQHGTVTVLEGREGFEVTTYRIDGEYQDRRHPSEVIFTSDLIEDLKRRDFTINAMAYSPKAGIIDEFEGMEDLKRGIIRAVGNAKERFTEDALRMLRAVRFSAQLGFAVEGETAAAVREMAGRLSLISKERIQAELDKLLLSGHPEYIRRAYELGITAVILPEFDRIMEAPQRNRYHDLSVGEHTLKTLQHVRADHLLRWTMLLHDFGKPKASLTDPDGTIHFHGHAKISAELAKGILKGLKFDNATLEAVTKLVYYHDFPFPVSKAGVRKALNCLGEELFPLLLEVCEADSRGKNRYAQETYLPKLLAIREHYREVREAGDCVSLKDLAINGRDLIAAGMKPGKELGDALERCLEEVLGDPEKNTREYLLESALRQIEGS